MIGPSDWLSVDFLLRYWKYQETKPDGSSTGVCNPADDEQNKKMISEICNDTDMMENVRWGSDWNSAVGGIDIYYSDNKDKTEHTNIMIRDLTDKGIIVYDRTWNGLECNNIKTTFYPKYGRDHSYYVYITFKRDGKEWTF